MENSETDNSYGVRISSIILAVVAFTVCIAIGQCTNVFGSMFADFGAQLPAITQLLSAPSALHWALFGGVLALIVILKDLTSLADVFSNTAIVVFLVLISIVAAVALMLPLMRVGVTLAE